MEILIHFLDEREMSQMAYKLEEEGFKVARGLNGFGKYFVTVTGYKIK